MVDFAAARTHMVDSQLRPNRVRDRRLIGAFETLPREVFVPESMRALAYVDEDLELADGRFLMEPMVLARLLEAADVRASDIALDIGATTGYNSAILAHQAATVAALESDHEMAQAAEGNLRDLGIDNAVVIEAALGEGYAKQAPYNVILISGAVSEVPQSILKQLADGGRLVTVIRPERGLGKAVLIERVGESFGRRNLFDAGTPYLPGFRKEPGFVF